MFWGKQRRFDSIIKIRICEPTQARGRHPSAMCEAQSGRAIKIECLSHSICCTDASKTTSWGNPNRVSSCYVKSWHGSSILVAGSRCLGTLHSLRTPTGGIWVEGPKLLREVTLWGFGSRWRQHRLRYCLFVHDATWSGLC